MKYPLKRIGDYIEILSGYAFKSKDFCENGIPVIKIKNITPPNVSLIDLSFVAQEVAETNKKFELNYNDVLIALTGSHINQMASVVGRVARVKYNDKTMLNQRVAKIYALDEKECNIDYLYQYLSQDSVKIALANKAGGAANQANISPSDIKNLIVPFPNIEVQNRIADILSAYDNLIENNQKQIKLLEEAAQRIYKEWFVDLRFPGHENMKIVDGVPEGWGKTTVGKTVKTTSGGTPSRAHSEYYNNGTNLWVKTKELKDGFIFDTEEKITDDAIKKSSAKIVPKGSILLAMYGATIGKLGIAFEDLSCNQACCVILFDIYDCKREYLYFWLLANREFLISQGKGAAQPNLSQANIQQFQIVLPNEKILKNFSNITKIMLEQKCNLELQIVKLQEVRDRLLPKLMSGELEV